MLSLSLYILNREFRLCLDYWLDLRMAEEGLFCLICHKRSDSFGDHHHVGCGNNGDRIQIRLYDSIHFSAAQSAAAEAPSLISGSSSRPADIYLQTGTKANQPLCDSYLSISGAANSHGHALNVGEEKRLTAHANDCQISFRLWLRLWVLGCGHHLTHRQTTRSTFGYCSCREHSSPFPEACNINGYGVEMQPYGFRQSIRSAEVDVGFKLKSKVSCTFQVL